MKYLPALFAAASVVLCAPHLHADQYTVLGAASTYGVLATSTVTNSGATTVTGDLGLYGGSSVTGFPPGQVVGGTMHVADSAAELAESNAQTALAYLSGLPSTQLLSGQDLGGLTLGPGVYTFSSSAALTGNLVLDFDGASDANIVFQIGSSLVTATNSTMIVVNQGMDDNVYFAVGSSATLGTGSVFAGDILATASADLATGAGSTCGSVMALDGAVTLVSNQVTNCSATGSDVTPRGGGLPQTAAAAPEPGALGLLGSGVAGGVGMFRRRLRPAR